MSVPPLGYTTMGRVVRVLDGDTVEVEISKRVRVRLLDCWAPETRTKDQEEKARGRESKHALESILGFETGFPEVRIHLAGDDDGDIGEYSTLSRRLGRIYTADGRDVSAEMVKAGHATKQK